MMVKNLYYHIWFIARFGYRHFGYITNFNKNNTSNVPQHCLVVQGDNCNIEIVYMIIKVCAVHILSKIKE